MAVTKAELAHNLMERMGLSRAESQVFVDSFFDLIAQELVKGGEVRLSGFGNFITRDKNSRPGRNPKTGEAVEIPARRVITFLPGRTLMTQIDPEKLGEVE